MHHPRSLLITLSLCAGIPWFGAQAQQKDSTRADTTQATTLETIEVTNSIAPTAGPVIGSGIPARISTVTGAQVDAWEPRILPDALASQAGISLYDDLGSPFKLNLSTRGFNVGPVVGLPPGVSVFLDGVRQNEPDAAEVNFDLLPMEHVDRVELLSGSASLLGPNSLGGAINLITRRGRGPLNAEAELSGGSYGSYSGEASVDGITHKGWDYYLAGGYENEDGWRQATGAENLNGFLNLGHRGPTRGISLQAFGADSRVEAAGSLPESVFLNSPATNFTIGDFDDLNQLQASLSGYATTGKSHGNFTGYVRRTHAERFNVNQAPDNNVRSFTDNRTIGGNADWRWTVPRKNGTFSFRVGADGGSNQVHIQLLEETPTVPSTSTLTTDVTSPSYDIAGYTLADLRLDQVTFSGGLRYDYIHVPFSNALDPTGDTTSTFTRLSPRAGISWDISPGASAYVSVGQSFRAPAILELACADETAACPLPFALGDDPPLDPVVGTTFELGGQLVRGPAIMNASVYRTNVRDDISFIQSENAIFEGFFANIGSTRREGIELSLQVIPTEHLSLYANYAFTRATFQDPAEIFSIRADSAFVGAPLAGPNDVSIGDRMPLVPEHEIKFGGMVSLASGLEFGVDGRYIGNQWLRGDEANETAPLDGYFVGNVRAGFSRAKWEVSAVVSNVLDSHHAIFGTFNENRQNGLLERFLTPMNARSLKLIVRRAFGSAQD
jgi:outer membrane receptor protein involved in Fe transport